MLTQGLEGQITTASAFSIAANNPGAGREEFNSVEFEASHERCAFLVDKILLKLQNYIITDHHSLDNLIAHRQDLNLDAPILA